MKDLDELKKLAEPLREWLSSNYNPMCRIVIERDEVTVQSSELSIPFNCTENMGGEKMYTDEFSYTFGSVLNALESLRLGLTTKQDYLTGGVIPKNLPHCIFLKEDIDQVVLVIEMLRTVLEKEPNN